MRFDVPNVLFVLLGFLISGSGLNASEQPDWKWYEVKDRKVELHLHVFWSETCPHCARARIFLGGLAKRHAWLRLFEYEVSRNPANMERYRAMAASLGQPAGPVPAFFHCKQLDIGYADEATTGARLERSLIRCRDALQQQVDRRPAPRPPVARPTGILLLMSPEEVPAAPDELDLDLALPPPEEPTVEVPGWGSMKVDEVSLPVLTIVLGGLDAFNPCAFFVLLILLGLIMHAGDRRKMLLVGAVFVFISGLVYFLFMAAWLNLFFLVGHLRVITLGAGIVAIVAALINIKDYFWFKKGVSLSLSDSARSRLVHRMIAITGRRSMLALLVGTAALAFAANLYELLCTSGLPLVYTRVLTLRQLTPAEYYGYLVLYNVIYVTPLLLIVTIFSFTLSAHKMTEYQGRLLKLISGTMMLALGVILIVDPAFLNHLLGAGITLAAAIGGAAVIAVVHRMMTSTDESSLPAPVKPPDVPESASRAGSG